MVSPKLHGTADKENKVFYLTKRDVCPRSLWVYYGYTSSIDQAMAFCLCIAVPWEARDVTHDTLVFHFVHHDGKDLEFPKSLSLPSIPRGTASEFHPLSHPHHSTTSGGALLTNTLLETNGGSRPDKITHKIRWFVHRGKIRFRKINLSSSENYPASLLGRYYRAIPQNPWRSLTNYPTSPLSFFYAYYIMNIDW